MNLTIPEFHQVVATFTLIENERELLYKISDFWKTVFWLATLMTLVTGWKMKHLMFKYIAKTGFRDQPINWLILTEQTVHLCCGSLVLVSYLTSQSLELSVGDMLDQHFEGIITDRKFCWIFCNVQLLSNVYRGINGVGMACVRFLYTTRGDMVRYLDCLDGKIAHASLLLEDLFKKA